MTTSVPATTPERCCDAWCSACNSFGDIHNLEQCPYRKLVEFLATNYSNADVEDAMTAAQIGCGTPQQALILAAEVHRLRGAFDDMHGQWYSVWSQASWVIDEWRRSGKVDNDEMDELAERV